MHQDNQDKDNQDQEGSRALLALSKPQDAQPAQTPELQRFLPTIIEAYR